jgi:hypothetical protein
VSLTEDGFIADVAHFTGVPIPADPVLRGTDDYVNADVANVSDARIEEVVSAALRLGTAHTPAVINEEARRSLAGFERHPADAQLRVLPDFWTPIWHLIWLAPNRGEKERIYEGFLDRERALLRALFASGAPVYAGTDTLMPFVAPGAALEEEVRNFGELGLTPEQALVTTTSAPGRFWVERQRRKNVGPIELGRRTVRGRDELDRGVPRRPIQPGGGARSVSGRGTRAPRIAALVPFAQKIAIGFTGDAVPR